VTIIGYSDGEPIRKMKAGGFELNYGRSSLKSVVRFLEALASFWRRRRTSSLREPITAKSLGILLAIFSMSARIVLLRIKAVSLLIKG